MMPTFERTPYPAEWFHGKNGRPMYYTEAEVADAITRNTKATSDIVTTPQEERVRRTTGGAKAWSIMPEPKGGTV